jgi:hypothetical protein
MKNNVSRLTILILVLSAAASLSAQKKHVGAKSQAPKPQATETVLPLEFRGIRLGMDLTEARLVVERHFPRGKGTIPPCGEYTELSCKDKARAAQSCSTYTACESEGKSDMQFLTLDFLEAKVVSIHFQFIHDSEPAEWTRNSIGVSFDNYLGIVTALRDKYGQGQQTVDAVQTKAGAHYDSDHSVWHHGTSILELEELCMNIDESCLTLEDKQLSEEFYRRLKAERTPDI